MVSHANLVAEINVVNSMSTEDRLTHARQRRQEQIQRWKDAQLDYESKNGEKLTNGDVPRDNRIVKFGASVTLLEAAARDDLNEVKGLLEGQTNPNEANDDGLTALHQACIDNFEDMVKLLIKHGANVNAIDSEHWTPLHAACTCGHTNIAKILIQSGADLLALNADNNMPYDICEEEETLDYVEKAMAGKGITQEQINSTRSLKERQIISDMQSIVEGGKDLNYKDEVGASVLHMAAANGYVDLARYLLLHNCYVNAKDDDGWTPLHAAACWNQLDVVELLGQQGADPTIKNSLGEQASDVTDDEEIKLLLLKIRASMKDKKSKKLFSGFRGFSSRNNSRRASGIRGQSFKGRSKRDKKSGISTIEAKSEAQFWSGHQENSDIKLVSKSTENNNHISTTGGSSEETSSKNITSVKKDKKNASKKESSSSEDNNETHSTAIHIKSDTLTKREKKQQKKAKKASESSQTMSLSDESPNNSEVNGLRSSSTGSIRNVISGRNQYSLEETDGENGTIKDGSSGKTLAELKRERAQDKSNKTSSLSEDGGQSGVTYSEDNIKHFKGLTTSDISTRSQKRKLCVIL